MFEKLRYVEEKYEELNRKISDPEVISNQEQWRKYMKEHAEIEGIVLKFRQYSKVKKDIEDAKALLNEKIDKDMKELAEMEISEGQEALVQIEEELKILLIPKDPNDEKNVIVEIRGGAGGEEAALFAGTLFRLYSRYAERNRWKTEIIDSNPTELGGFKEVVFMIEGQGAYSRLKFESGVHRVQRVPDTEASGRIHTSTVTVAVLPEVEDVDVEINQNDLRIDTYRSSGAGGQHINKTDSAIRITHNPTGIVVACQDERSQLKNKEKAMKILRSRLYEKAQQEQDSQLAQERKSQVGTGDRSEKIRTYNYPQGRVTDHRINYSMYQIDAFCDGEIDEIVDALITVDRAEKLKYNEQM